MASDWLTYLSWDRSALLPWDGLAFLGLLDNWNIDTPLGWSRLAFVLVSRMADLLWNILAHLPGDIVALLYGDIFTFLLWGIVTLWFMIHILSSANFLVDSLALLFVSCGALLLTHSAAHFLVDCGALLRWNLCADNITDGETLLLFSNLYLGSAHLHSSILTL